MAVMMRFIFNRHHPIVDVTRTASLPCTDISKTDACGMVNVALGGDCMRISVLFIGLSVDKYPSASTVLCVLSDLLLSVKSMAGWLLSSQWHTSVKEAG